MQRLIYQTSKEQTCNSVSRLDLNYRCVCGSQNIQFPFGGLKTFISSGGRETGSLNLALQKSFYASFYMLAICLDAFSPMFFVFFLPLRSVNVSPIFCQFASEKDLKTTGLDNLVCIKTWPANDGRVPKN